MGPSSVKLVATLCMILSGSIPVHATFHLMQIEQVIGGVNGDRTAQAIQLRMRLAGQDLVSGAKLVVFDAAGANPVTVLDLTSNVANKSLGDRILIASANFTNYTSSLITPDFIMSAVIPASYLAAGSLVWENDLGTQILWRLSWGGVNYTGSNAGDALHTNDADGDFGPPFPGVLSSGNTSALLFTNTAAALSRSNVVDYIVTPSAAVFRNNSSNAVTVVTDPNPRILSILTNANNSVMITWKIIGGKTNVVQVTPGTPPTGSFSTNNFTDLSGNSVGAGNGESITNFVETGAATNGPARYYRIRATQ